MRKNNVEGGLGGKGGRRLGLEVDWGKKPTLKLFENKK